MRPSRLGLARVSVLRGQGAAKGACCIDDYIKCAEPVYDYLTKFRWAPGRGGERERERERVFWGCLYVCVCAWVRGVGMGWCCVCTCEMAGAGDSAKGIMR